MKWNKREEEGEEGSGEERRGEGEGDEARGRVYEGGVK